MAVSVFVRDSVDRVTKFNSPKGLGSMSCNFLVEQIAIGSLKKTVDHRGLFGAGLLDLPCGPAVVWRSGACTMPVWDVF